MTNKKQKIPRDIGVGTEIECILNDDLEHINSLEEGEYHDGVKLNTYWEMQADSSLDYEGKFPNERCSEIVSYKQTSRENFFKALKSFENLISDNGTYELKNVVYFNKSCGCHIHFSCGKRKFKDLIPFEYIIRLRKVFFDKLDKSKIIKEEHKKAIKEHYFRHYAIKLTKDNYTRGRERHSEFNVQSEEAGYGLEWRSFNLRNITSWDEFHELFKIAFDSLEYLFNIKEKGYTMKQNIKIPKKELKEIFKEEEKTLNKTILFLHEIDLTPKNNEYSLKKEEELRELKFGDYSNISNNVEESISEYPQEEDPSDWEADY